jgi:hypothetical protein
MTERSKIRDEFYFISLGEETQRQKPLRNIMFRAAGSTISEVNTKILEESREKAFYPWMCKFLQPLARSPFRGVPLQDHHGAKVLEVFSGRKGFRVYAFLYAVAATSGCFRLTGVSQG